MADFTQNTEQKRNFHANPTTASGAPATVDGAGVWTSSDPTDGAPVATGVVLTPAADGLSCFVNGGAGELDLTCDVDADLGAGVRHVTKTVRVAILTPEADAIGISADDAVPL